MRDFFCSGSVWSIQRKKLQIRNVLPPLFFVFEQFMTRGGAFGEGYTERLINLIKANANQFADANTVIEFVFDMAPHQSDYLSSVKSVSTYTMDHAGIWFGDPLSDNAKAGVKAAFTSKEGGNLGGGHRIPTFANDITAFTRSFTKAKINRM